MAVVLLKIVAVVAAVARMSNSAVLLLCAGTAVADLSRLKNLAAVALSVDIVPAFEDWLLTPVVTCKEDAVATPLSQRL